MASSTLTPTAGTSATYDLGDVVSLTVEVKTAAGVLAAATAVTLTITKPDGTTATPTVSSTSTGVYTASYSPTVAGRYALRWVATGTNAAAYADAFTVFDTTELGLVGLDDAKAHLNISSSTSDEELRVVLMAATAAAEDYLRRPLRRATKTQTFYGPAGNGLALILDRPDVASITSIDNDGDTLTDDDYAADLNAGVIWRSSGWDYPVVVSYVSRGLDSPAIRQAVLELVRHLWETQRGSMPMLPRGVDGMDSFNPAMSYSLPRRVTELLAPHRMPQ